MTTRNRFWLYFPILPLFLFAWLSIGSGIQESSTWDEPGHLASGYRFWVTGKYALDLAHPPLLRLWASLPLLAEHLETPPLLIKGQRGGLAGIVGDWLYKNRMSGITILNSARVMMVFWGVALGWLVWYWTKEVFGLSAATAAVIFYSFNPSFIAHTPLITTDMGAAAFSVLSLYLFWKFWENPSRRMAVVAGVGFGLAMSAKFSALLLLPIFCAIVALLLILNSSDRKNISVDFILRLIYMAMAAGFVLTAFYKFTEWQRLAAGIWEVFFTRALHVHYFAGHIYEGSPKWFFAMVFLLKTPLPYLIALCIAGIWALRHSFPHKQFLFVWILMPCLAYFAISSTSSFQSGIRRILFLYPMLSIAGGAMVASSWRSSRAWRLICLVLGLWYVAGAVQAYPDFIPYTNEVVGGSTQAYKYFLDCNLDWGQGIGALARYLKQQGITKIYLCPFGSVDPHAFGIQYIPIAAISSIDLPGDDIDMRKEKKTLFAISQTNRVGLYYPDRSLFKWLETKRPVVIVAHSIWVYDFTGDVDAHRHLAALLEQEGRKELAARERVWGSL